MRPILVIAFASVATAPCLAQKTLWDDYIRDGKQADDRGDHSKALKLYTFALEEAEKFGPADPRLATSLNNLATLFQSQRDYASAVPLCKLSLGIFEKTLGPDHPTLAISLHNLAWLYRAERDFTKAEPLFKRSLAICEKALGPNHPDVASSLENYAILLRATQRAAEVEKCEARISSLYIRTAPVRKRQETIQLRSRRRPAPRLTAPRPGARGVRCEP